MKKYLKYALAKKTADLLIRNVRLCNVFSLEYETTSVAVCDDIIVGVGSDYTGKVEVDGTGKVLFPGLIDGHIHIESSLLTPSRFVEATVIHGTTTIMADPHEIANVGGLAGVEAMHEAAQGLPQDIYLGAPSCVPASSFESCYSPLAAKELSELFQNGSCHHLGEMMNFPGVINGEQAVWAKIDEAQARGLILTAHAPGLTGPSLAAYLISGCDGDHESNTYHDALEKMRRGMWLMLRYGTLENNVKTLLPLILENPARSSRCMVVSDDINVHTILGQGHLDRSLRYLIAEGLNPLVALRLLTLSPAEFFKLPKVGGIAPGWKADLVLADSLDNCLVEKVWKNGRLVVDNGQLLLPELGSGFTFSSLPQVELTPLVPEQIRVQRHEGLLRVIGNPYSVITKTLYLTPVLLGDEVVACPDQDIVKMVVRERHHNRNLVGIGFIQGLGITKGAIASSVAHDAHNFSAAGVDDQSILTALEWLRLNRGGLVVTEGQMIIMCLPLPVAGLMSDQPVAKVAESLAQVTLAAKNLSSSDTDPFMALSFLSLSVIPELKLTDQGYVDITRGGHQELFVISKE